MKILTTRLCLILLVLCCFALSKRIYAADPTPPAEKVFEAPHGMKLGVKMIGPYAQATDLQVICVFKHKTSGDSYIAAMKDLDDKLGGLLSSLRNRGEFVGELGETICFIPPVGSTQAKQFLVIGLGDESQLSLKTMQVIGTVALRTAVNLKAAHVSFAPVLRDQGNNKLDVGDCDRSVAEGLILAYDTEKRLQAQGLAAPFDIEDWTIEAGPAFFAGVSEQLPVAIKTSGEKIAKRENSPYSAAKTP